MLRASFAMKAFVRCGYDQSLAKIVQHELNILELKVVLEVVPHTTVTPRTCRYYLFL